MRPNRAAIRILALNLRYTGIQAHQDMRLLTCFAASHSVVLCEQQIVRRVGGSHRMIKVISARLCTSAFTPTNTESTPCDPSLPLSLFVVPPSLCLPSTRFTLSVMQSHRCSNTKHRVQWFQACHPPYGGDDATKQTLKPGFKRA